MTDPESWLLLIHQLPAEPAYLRVKILRRLKGVGAVALKNSVYALPHRESCREDFQWIMEELSSGGGSATLSSARFLEGATDAELRELFNRDRNAEYADLAEMAGAAASSGVTRADIDRFTRQLQQILERDHFGAPARTAAEKAVADLKGRLAGGAPLPGGAPVASPVGATWVTRRGVYVDRMASAWLIGRFIDPRARFRFVPERGYAPADGEILFDMFEGGFTHEGDRCTFETLVARFGLSEAALGPIAQIVHDIDCKDEKFGRPEAAGIASVLRGIAAGHVDDTDRIAAAAHVFDGLLARFQAPTEEDGTS